MRNDNQAANLFATLGQFQGNVTANTRNDRVALVLTDALCSISARYERPIARRIVRVGVSGAIGVVKRLRGAMAMRMHHAPAPRLAGNGPRQWLLSSRLSPAGCSVRYGPHGRPRAARLLTRRS